MTRQHAHMEVKDQLSHRLAIALQKVEPLGIEHRFHGDRNLDEDRVAVVQAVFEKPD